MVRITGMNSGLDTETIITELASARSVKVQSMQKKQTKMSWKMDAWKELNSKVYKFYTSTLDNMRFASGYSKKSTSVSDSSVASVVTGGNAMSGTQTLKVKQLAQSAYMTGGKIMRAESDGTYKKVDVTGKTFIGELGVQEDFSLKVKVNGEEKELKFHADATIDEIVGKIKECGVNANFDEKNGRIFIGAPKTGAEYDFSITAGEGEASTKVLTALGLNTEATGDQKAQKIDGKDAIIELNGATFTSNTNAFEINGLTITVNKTTDDNGVILNTQQDTSGIYDMIKSFFKDYNELINEIDKLYGAEDASKYDPLTDEEKDAMSDKEVEEWEKKIKDSLLRRDDVLGTLRQSIFDVMSTAVTMKDGSKLYLNDFGINTLNYFTAPENEKHAYHIDGDSDDDSTKNNADVLKGLIASDPDKVSEFFVGLSSALYKKLGDKMAKSTSSSAFTVYNDKLLKEEYQNYSSKIEKEQKKLNDYIDRWYDKFSAMEVALGKLDSKSSSIAGMLGM